MAEAKGWQVSQLEVETVRVGEWLYDGKVPMPVRIIVQNWDYYYEEGYDPEEPDLNASGLAFYVVYGEQSVNGGYRSRSRTCLSLVEAIALAEETVGRIAWQT